MALITVLIITGIIIITTQGNPVNDAQTFCAFTENNVRLNGGKSIHIVEGKSFDGDATGEVFANGTQKCAADVQFCFSLWLADVDQPSNSTVLLRGCWSEEDQCNDNSCIARESASKDTKLPDNLRFCCCRGSYCNVNETVGPLLSTVSQPTVPPDTQKAIYDPNYKSRTILIAIAIIFLGSVVVVSIYVAATCFQRKLDKRSFEQPSLVGRESCGELSKALGGAPWELDAHSLDALTFGALVSGGRFSDVYKGRLHEENVAVKVFMENNQRQYYISERDVYTLPFMQHSSFAKFYGTGERETDVGPRQYMVVLEYVELGTLTHYLKHNTLDWVKLCKMCRSLASGLSHLHQEIVRGDKKKPAVVHRDLNSRNILVREDMGLVIVDFGFAMQIDGCRVMRNGSEQTIEQSSLTDVGTQRYMAPEILEGAVNLRDCEASLKQIDVYAIGLLFWEIGTRCTDMFQGLPVPDYKLPFEAEIGAHPTFDDMQLLVSKNKGRPLFPLQWKDSNQAIRAYKETIEDCWDQDGDARLTALCVEERCLEIEALWARQKGGSAVSTSNFDPPPTILPEKRPELCNIHPVSSTPGYCVIAAENQRNEVLGTGSHLSVQQQNARNLLQEPRQSASCSQTERSISSSGLSSNQLSVTSSNRVTDESLQSSVTTDTLLSPLENTRPPNVAYPPNSVYFSRDIKKPLYSHQGENPTVARNTHKASDEDIQIQGNSLIHTSQVGSTSGFSRPGEQLIEAIVDQVPATSVTSHLDPSSGAVGGGVASRVQSSRGPQHIQSRIPYMQNDVASEPLIVRPKQPNTQPSPPKKSFIQKLGLDRAASKLNLSIFNRSPHGYKKSGEKMDETVALKSDSERQVGYIGNGYQVGSQGNPDLGISPLTAQVWPTSHQLMEANKIGSGGAAQQQDPFPGNTAIGSNIFNLQGEMKSNLVTAAVGNARELRHTSVRPSEACLVNGQVLIRSSDHLPSNGVAGATSANQSGLPQDVTSGAASHCPLPPIYVTNQVTENDGEGFRNMNDVTSNQLSVGAVDGLQQHDILLGELSRNVTSRNHTTSDRSSDTCIDESNTESSFEGKSSASDFSKDCSAISGDILGNTYGSRNKFIHNDVTAKATHNPPAISSTSTKSCQDGNGGVNRKSDMMAVASRSGSRTGSDSSYSSEDCSSQGSSGSNLRAKRPDSLVINGCQVNPGFVATGSTSQERRPNGVADSKGAPVRKPTDIALKVTEKDEYKENVPKQADAAKLSNYHKNTGKFLSANKAEKIATWLGENPV